MVGLSFQVGRTLHGALKYQDISLEEVMTPVKEAFMLQVDEKLDMDLMARIFREGYSRIPIYDQSVDDIVGLMLVKDLVFVDPNDRLPVRSFLRRFARHVQVSVRTGHPTEFRSSSLRLVQKESTQ